MVGDVVRSNGNKSQDAELEMTIMDALIHYSGVRVWTDALEIKVRDGVAYLGGHVRTHAEREVTAKVVRQVKGVREIVNDLYVDGDIEIAVAQVLGNDPRTRVGFPGILIGSAFGQVFLKGNVASQEIKNAAGELAAKVQGVRDIHNELVAPEPPKPAAPPAAKTAAAKTPAKTAPKPAPKPADDESTGEGETEE